MFHIPAHKATDEMKPAQTINDVIQRTIVADSADNDQADSNVRIASCLQEMIASIAKLKSCGVPAMDWPEDLQTLAPRLHLMHRQVMQKVGKSIG